MTGVALFTTDTLPCHYYHYYHHHNAEHQLIQLQADLPWH
jgi:hypothetical protein